MTSRTILSRYLLLVAVILITACSSEKETPTIPSITINQQTAEKITLKEAFPEYQLFNIQLPDSVFFGNVEQIKSDDDYLYLLDPFQSKTVTILDKKGKFINQLKRPGRGPGEYVSPYAFAIDKTNNQLLLYDRGKLEMITYSLPDLNYISHKRIDMYLMNFEVLDDDHLLMVRDDSRDKKTLNGLEIWTRDYEPVKGKLSDMRNAVIELSYPSTIGLDNDQMVYVHPFTGTFNQITPDGLTPLLKMNFGESEVPERLYELDDALAFEAALEKSKYALWGRYPVKRNGEYMCWYMYGDVDSYYLSSFNLETNKTTTYKELSHESLYGKLPIPMGIDGNRYVSLIPSEMVKEDYTSNKMEAQLIKQSVASELPMLMFY